MMVLLSQCLFWPGPQNVDSKQINNEKFPSQVKRPAFDHQMQVWWILLRKYLTINASHILDYEPPISPCGLSSAGHYPLHNKTMNIALNKFVSDFGIGPSLGQTSHVRLSDYFVN